MANRQINSDKKVKVSDYRKQVLDVNAKLKTAQKSLGGCIANLRMFHKEIGVKPLFKRYLDKTKKDQDTYEELKSNVRFRKDKEGNVSDKTSSFVVLQTLYRMEKEGIGYFTK